MIGYYGDLTTAQSQGRIAVGTIFLLTSKIHSEYLPVKTFQNDIKSRILFCHAGEDSGIEECP